MWREAGSHRELQTRGDRWVQHWRGRLLPPLPDNMSGTIAVCDDGYVTVTLWVRGEKVVLREPASEFPSETFTAQVMLVT